MTGSTPRIYNARSSVTGTCVTAAPPAYFWSHKRWCREECRRSWRKRSREGDALSGDVPHSALGFLCATPSLPRAPALPAAGAAQRGKTMAADPKVPLPGRGRNRWVCQPGWKLQCVVVRASAALRLSAKDTHARGPAAISAWQFNLRLPVLKMTRTGEKQQPGPGTCRAPGHMGLRVVPGREAPSWT